MTDTENDPVFVPVPVTLTESDADTLTDQVTVLVEDTDALTESELDTVAVVVAVGLVVTVELGLGDARKQNMVESPPNHSEPSAETATEVVIEDALL